MRIRLGVATVILLVAFGLTGQAGGQEAPAECPAGSYLSQSPNAPDGSGECLCPDTGLVTGVVDWEGIYVSDAGFTSCDEPHLSLQMHQASHR